MTDKRENVIAPDASDSPRVSFEEGYLDPKDKQRSRGQSVICHFIRRRPDDISDSDPSRRRLTKKVHPKMNSSSAASSVGRQRLERFGTALQCDLIGGRHYATYTGRSVAKS